MVLPESLTRGALDVPAPSRHNSQAQLSPAARLNAAGLVVAVAGIMIQYVSGVDFLTIPPGPIILLVAAAVVVFGPWRRAPAGGLVTAACLVDRGRDQLVLFRGWHASASPRKAALPAHRHHSPSSAA
jgi:hypothetical protein